MEKSLLFDPHRKQALVPVVSAGYDAKDGELAETSSQLGCALKLNPYPTWMCSTPFYT